MVVVLVKGGPQCGPHPTVIDGASDLLEQLWGPLGCHARSAVGLSSLPSNVSVEIELVVEVR
jgi:enamine deaminase RidA (YjgF/YER057c/UK114 family)